METALENLKERLSAPRLRAPGTIQTYLEIAKRFLAQLGDKEPTESEFRRYFINRREQEISERTLRKEFFCLKKLALANGWEWTFTADDTPPFGRRTFCSGFNTRGRGETDKSSTSLSEKGPLLLGSVDNLGLPPGGACQNQEKGLRRGDNTDPHRQKRPTGKAHNTRDPQASL